MTKKLFFIALVVLCLFTANLFAQTLTTVGQSSEWEATGFNNGRREVRDCNGYLHMVWHSQDDPNQAPAATNSDIFYAVISPGGGVIVPPTNLTINLPDLEDGRYPSIAIEYDGIDNFYDWLNYTDIHVVFQGLRAGNTAYEVYYFQIGVANPPLPPAPLTWAAITNLSNTPQTNSLVPAIAINKMANMDPVNGQQIHVVWQEENIPSDIYYNVSGNTGATWGAPQNITMSPDNSQMPSIAASTDTYYGYPIDYSGNDAAYNCTGVHVSYNEDVPPSGINVYHLYSPTNGMGWNPPYNVSTNGGGPDSELNHGYSNIAVDMLDNPHIVYMTDLVQNSPSNGYTPGIDPSVVTSFPGPDPGMYRAIVNSIAYWGSAPALPANAPPPDDFDMEFPTIAMDRYNDLEVNWQEICPCEDTNYEIGRYENANLSPVTRPLTMPSYGAWSTKFIDNPDAENDDLFPNFAVKRVSMWDNVAMPGTAYFSEVWTKLNGKGVSAAIAPFMPKSIMEYNNVLRDPLFY